jgi:hypothetical protein
MFTGQHINLGMSRTLVGTNLTQASKLEKGKHFLK